MTKLLVLVTFLALALGACAGHDSEPAAPVDPCAAFDACAAVAGSSVTCINGDCACMVPTHPGENTPVSCHVGAPVSDR